MNTRAAAISAVNSGSGRPVWSWAPCTAPNHCPRTGRSAPSPPTLPAAPLSKHPRTPVPPLSTCPPRRRGPEPIDSAGPGGYLDTLRGMAGSSNAMADRVAKPWARISVETIISARPDFILEVRPPDKAVDMDQIYRGWSVLTGVPAISKRQIRSLTSTAIAKHGPRINIALHETITAPSKSHSLRASN